MPGELTGKTVLLVDDDRDILTAMKAALEELGPAIFTATNGDEALIQAQEHNPDLVVLDMMLPKRSGFLVMEKLKRGKKRTDLPHVIMVTGNEGARHKVYAESLGVEAYLNKPFRMEKLLDSVRGLLGAGR
jgi:DNA-binding response OmpR family regulator